MRKQHAFTLVELLMVIAIISVLAALLLPSIENAIEMARKTDCSNRLRQMMVLAGMYEQDNRTMLPGYITNPISGGITNGWAYPELMVRGGLLDPNVRLNAYSNDTVVKVNRILRPMTPNLCPNGLITGTSGGSGDSGCVGYGNRGDYTPESIKILDGVDNVFWRDTDGIQHGSTIASSFGISGGLGYFTPINDQDHGITYRYQTPNGFWQRRICLTPTNASRRLFFLEHRDYTAIAQYFTIPNYSGWNENKSRCPHLNMALFSCYDGHVGSITWDMMAYASGDKTRAQEAVADHFEW